MRKLLERFRRKRMATTADLNVLVDAINRLNNLTASGSGVIMTNGPQGPHLHINAAAAGGSNMYIAQIDSVRPGSKGGYYNCHLQSFDATDWDSTTANQTDDIGSSVVVLNIAEIPYDPGAAPDTGDQHLTGGDYIFCCKFNDDEGTARYIGIGCPRYTVCP